MKRQFSALVVTASLLAGGCGAPKYAPNRPALQQAFERTLDYWDQQGLTVGIGRCLKQ